MKRYLLGIIFLVGLIGGRGDRVFGCPPPCPPNGTASVCAGSSTMVTGGSTFGTPAWSTDAPTIATVDGSGNVYGVSPGIANITYNNFTFTCSFITAVTVSSPAAITGTFGICQGATTTLTDATTGGTWSSSSPGDISIGTSSGIVTVSVTTVTTPAIATITYMASTGCTVNATVTANPLPDISSFTPSAVSVCLGSGSTVNVSSSLLDGTYTVNYSLSGANTFTGTAILATASGSGAFTIPSGSLTNVGSTIVTVNSIQNITLCSSSLTGGNTSTFMVNTAPSIVATTPGSTCGSGTVTLGATASAGTVNWYTESTGGSSVSTGTSFTTPVISSTTTYWVDATNGGCTTASRSSVIASVSAAPTITATTPGSVCSSGAVTLGATASAGTVNWYTASSGGAPISTGISFTTPVISSSTTYWVDATNGGCTTASRTSVLASVTTMPVITGTTAASRCGAGTVTLGATASGGIINWYAASTGGSSIFSGASFITPVISSTTTYWVAAIATGCATASRSAVTATINTIPTIASTTPASRCGPGTLALAATASAGSINWYVASSGGASIFSGGTYTTPSISSTTTYWVDATNGGCTTTSRSSVSATVTTISVITGTTPASRCAAGTVALAATASAGTINWYTASTGGSSIFSGGTYTTPVISSTTTYWVDATSSGCTTATRSSVTASVNSLPTITATAMPTPLCAGQTLNLNSSPTGGSGIYTNFTWTGPSGFSAATQNTSIAGIATSGAGTYNVTVTDNNGCVSALPGTTASVVVNALPLITATATPNPICAGQTLTLHSLPTGGGGTYVSYGWTGPASFIASSQNTSILSIAAGQAGVYNVTVTDNNGCTSHIGATTLVVVNPLPAVTAAATPNPICAAAMLSLTATPGGGTPPYTTFTWSGPGGFTAGTQNNTIANIAASAAGVYSVTVTDNKGCTSANPGTTAAVVVNPLPSSITGATNVCIGSVTTLNATPATGTWNSSNVSNAAVVSGTGVVSGISAGDVVITYTLPTGCLVTTPFTVNPLPASIGGNTVLCSGQTTTFNDATLPGSWHSDNTNVATIIAGSGVITGVGSGGTATVTYTLLTGCITTENVTVNALPTTPVITTTTPTTLCLNTMYQSFGASAPGASESYEWTATNGMWAEDKPNNQNCLVNFTTQGFDTVMLTATNQLTGCQSHASAIVTVTANANSSVQTDSVINFESSLICLQTGVTYMWGYDVTGSLFEGALPSVSPYNNTSQNYYFNYSPDFTDTLFWVKTTDPTTGCFEKSYYYAPAKNKGFNTNTNSGGLGDMKVYPNPAGNYLNVLFDNIENNVTLKISDIMGRDIIITSVQNVLTGIDVSGLQPSVYFIECYQNGVRVADSKFIKN